MSYEIDRDPTQEPSLKEMSKKALKFLESANANSNKGFFLMIEGSKIGNWKVKFSICKFYNILISYLFVFLCKFVF